MIIQLQPSQISLFWDAIQHGFLQTNPPPVGVSSLEYSNKVLQNLLNQKYQCWLVYELRNEEKILVAIGVTAITKELLTDVSILNILSLYGFRRLKESTAVNAFNDFLTYAKNTDCVKVCARTSVKRVTELASMVGFTKEFESYSFSLRG